MTRENIGRVLLFTIGLMLDQPAKFRVDPLKHKYHFQKITAIALWITWTSAALQISQVYKSTIFSCLSKVSIPHYPKTLSELTKSEMHVTTIEWANQNISSFMVNNVLNERGLPLNFVVLDQEDVIETMVSQLQIFSKKWVSKPIHLRIFTRRTAWIAFRNYFYPPFTRSLAQIYESGVYSRWESYLKTKLIRKEIMYIQSRIGNRNSERSSTQVSLILDNAHSQQESASIIRTFDNDNNSTLHIFWKLVSLPNLQYHFRKFESCIVRIYPRDHIFNPLVLPDDEGGIPDFIFFLKPKSFESEEYGENIIFYVELRALAIPAVLIEIEDLSTVSLICIPCTLEYTNRYRFLIDTENSMLSISAIRKHWFELHTNMKGIPVHARLFPNFTDVLYIKMNRNTPCHPYTKDLFQAIICTNLFISKKLNYSLHDYTSDIQVYTQITSNLLVGGINLQFTKNSKFHWIPYAYQAIPYTFITVLQEPPGNFEAILKPFQWYIWIAILSASGCITGLFSSFSHYPDTFRTTLHLLGFMMDQPTGQYFFRKNSHFAIILLWALWSLFGMNISQFYKGSIFSFLSQQPTPTIPLGLHSLVESGMRVVTSDTYKTWDKGKVILEGSILKDNILTGMIQNNQNNSLGHTCKKLNSSLMWLSDNNHEFALNMVKNRTLKLGDGNVTDMPRQFALIDPETSVNRNKILIEFLTHNWVSKKVIVPLFMYRDSWAVYSNFFAPFFINALTQVYESGIYDRWYRISRIKTSNNIIRSVNTDLQGMNASSSLNKYHNKVPINRLFNYNFMAMENGHGKSIGHLHFKTIPSSVYFTMIMKFPNHTSTTGLINWSIRAYNSSKHFRNIYVCVGDKDFRKFAEDLFLNHWNGT
ncbi:unnamed protein product [Orchesella dallaii]|uniref:Uncharacterized protein n=1 Tax=Orchesella dallaii TaxID=48710 RepID=A0ABP1RF13_9HEXA